MKHFIHNTPHNDRFVAVFAAIIASFVLATGSCRLAPLQRSGEIISDLEPGSTPSITENLTEDPAVESLTGDELATQFEYQSQIIIKAINPGYTISGKANTNEFIEFLKLTDEPLALADYSFRLTNDKGEVSDFALFEKGEIMTGQTFVARYNRAPDRAERDFLYSIASVSQKSGKIELFLGDEVVDSVCWGNAGESCAVGFTNTKPETKADSEALLRDLDTGNFSIVKGYEPYYDEDNPGITFPSDEASDESSDASEEETTTAEKTNTAAAGIAKCRGLEFSEVFTYYETSADEQYIELYNSTSQEIALDGCQIRYKKKLYDLSGKVAANGYYVFYPKSNPTFTKNPTSSNLIELIDADSTAIDEISYPHGQKKSAAYARFYDSAGAESWAITYNLTPGAENQFQEFQTCEAGKVINPLTGNCVKSTDTSSTLAECPEGKYRNPLTGRCKNIESDSSTTKDCAEGYERNPETNRCRKIKTENTGEDYALVPNTDTSETTTNFTAIWIIIGVIVAGVIYIILQFRREIVRMLRKARQRFHDIFENFVTRKVRRHRDKEP